LPYRGPEEQGRLQDCKKKAGGPFLEKEWYDIKTPSVFCTRNCGKTLVSRTAGTKIATEEIKGRVLEVNLADLKNDEDQSYKRVKLCIEEVQGCNCLADFYIVQYSRWQGLLPDPQVGLPHRAARGREDYRRLPCEHVRD
jgi:hypothetical protein